MLEWLVGAFGFVELTRMLTADGKLSHAEVETPGGGLLMLAAPAGYINPRRLAGVSPEWRQATDNPWVIDGILVYVPDIEAHCELARADGARILREAGEHGPRPSLRRRRPRGTSLDVHADAGLTANGHDFGAVPWTWCDSNASQSKERGGAESAPPLSLVPALRQRTRKWVVSDAPFWP